MSFQEIKVGKLFMHNPSSLHSEDINFKTESGKFSYMENELELEMCNYLVCDSVEDCLEEYENYKK